MDIIFIILSILDFQSDPFSSGVFITLYKPYEFSASFLKHCPNRLVPGKVISYQQFSTCTFQVSYFYFCVHHWGVEIGGRMPKIEDVGDICLREPRSTQLCRADYDDDTSLGSISLLKM